MAQSGATVISLYNTSTVSAVPLNTNLIAGELAINTVDEKLYFKNSSGVVKLLASNAASATTFSAGSTGLTPSTATSGSVILAGTLNVVNGGTGVTTSTGSGNTVLSTSPTLVTPALGTPSALVGTNITGTAASFTAGSATSATALAVGRTIAITGDVSYTSPSFDGSANVTAVGTLATVATAGTTGSSTAIPVVTINAKGLTTSVTTVAVIAPAGTLSGSSLAAGVTASSLTSLGTIASLTATAGTVANTPTASTDIANKLYVDTVAQGLDAKASCVAATTADITLSGTQTIDGIAVVAGTRILVKNQTLSQNNGIYLCAAGAWTRTTDANTFESLVSAFTFVETGTVNSDIGFVCTANSGGTLGTTPLPFAQFSSAGSFTAGTGLTLTGSVFSLTSPVAVVNGGTGLTSLGSGITTFLGTPTSANLASAITDETGTGALVFATSPTLITPILGTPASIVLTNATGLPLITGVTGILAIASGGTNSSATPTAGSVGYGTGTAHAYTAAGTAGQVLVSTGAGAPVFAGISGGTF